MSKVYFSTKTERSKFYRYINLLANKVSENSLIVRDKNKFIFFNDSYYVELVDNLLNINEDSNDLFYLINSPDLKTLVENDSSLDNINENLTNNSFILDKTIKRKLEDIKCSLKTGINLLSSFKMPKEETKRVFDYISSSDKYVKFYSNFLVYNNKIVLESMYTTHDLELGNIMVVNNTELDHFTMSIPLYVYDIFNKINFIEYYVYKCNDDFNIVNLKINIEDGNINIDFFYRCFNEYKIKKVL